MSLQFHDTLGATFVGFNVSCIVLGILSSQVWNYFTRYPEDRLSYKIMVYTLWALELLDQIFIGVSIYYYNVTFFRSPLVMFVGDVIPTLIIQVLVSVTVGTIVKCCFAMRVWRFSKRNIWITGAIFIFIFAQLGLASWYCYRAFKLNKLLLAPKLTSVATISLGSGLVTDVLIAGALCFYLKRMRTGYRKTDTIVNTLCIYAVNTGALTGAASLATIILYNVWPTTFYFMAPYFTLGKLYAISFLCTLNTRRVVHGRGTDKGNTTSKNSNNWRTGSHSNTWRTGNTSGAHLNQFSNSSNQGQSPRKDAYEHYEHEYPPISPQQQVEIGVHREISVKSDIRNSEVIPYLPKQLNKLGYNYPV